MFCKGLMSLRRATMPLAMSAVILTGTSIALSSTTAAAATSASSSSGVWPGVGKICEPGPGGASSVRGVGDRTVNIAVFNDAANTILPGLEVEFSQQATAFDTKQRALLDKVSAYLSGVQTMVGNFVQIGPDGGRTEGTFYIQKPGRVRFTYNAPSPIDIVADGSSVVVRDRKLATQDLYPLSQTPLRYLLADHIDLLKDTDVVSVTTDDTFTTVVIEQKQVMIGTSRLMMMFDAKDTSLKQWTVTDPQGFDTTVAVYNLDTAKKPDPNLFVINYARDGGGISNQ